MWIRIREKAHGNQRLVHRGESEHILEGTPRQLSEAGDGRGGLRDHDELVKGWGGRRGAQSSSSYSLNPPFLFSACDNTVLIFSHAPGHLFLNFEFFLRLHHEFLLYVSFSFSQ